MKKLPQEAFNMAKRFISTQGRPLDQVLMAYLFADEHSSKVIGELSAFQNPDGGFGNALEPDIRTLASSAIATQQGFDYALLAGAEVGEPLVRKGIDYLLNTLDRERLVWPIIPREVENAPHAPWWGYADSDENFGGFRANPTAALAGFLNTFSAGVPKELLSSVSDHALAYLTQTPDEDMKMHDMLCFLTLADTLAGPKRARVLAKLAASVNQTVEHDQQKWREYTLRPLAVAPDPDSPMTSVLGQSIIDANLDYEIDEQLADGSWPLMWSWDFIDEDAWRQAKLEWKGHHALRKLLVFRAYGRLD